MWGASRRAALVVAVDLFGDVRGVFVWIGPKDIAAATAVEVIGLASELISKGSVRGVDFRIANRIGDHGDSPLRSAPTLYLPALMPSTARSNAATQSRFFAFGS